MFSDKIVNFIYAMCFGSVGKHRNTKLDVWNYEQGIEFFIPFFLSDMPSGAIPKYEELLAPAARYFGVFDRSWSYTGNKL